MLFNMLLRLIQETTENKDFFKILAVYLIKMYSESKLVSPFFLVIFVLENIENRFRMNVVNFLGLFLEKRVYQFEHNRI